MGNGEVRRVPVQQATDGLGELPRDLNGKKIEFYIEFSLIQNHALRHYLREMESTEQILPNSFLVAREFKVLKTEANTLGAVGSRI